MIYLYIFIGGGLGSLARFLTGKLSSSIFPTDFPVGTMLSNVLACIILASITLFYSKSTQFDWIQPLILVGFCGGFSTFSTFGNETFELMDSGNHFYAILNIILSVLLGIAMIYLIRSKA